MVHFGYRFSCLVSLQPETDARQASLRTTTDWKKKSRNSWSYGTCEEIKKSRNSLQLRDLKWWSISAFPKRLTIVAIPVQKHYLALVEQKNQGFENGTKWHLFSRHHIMPTAAARTELFLLCQSFNKVLFAVQSIWMTEICWHLRHFYVIIN